MARVEAILGVDRRRTWPLPPADTAVWICACATHLDAPTWLIQTHGTEVLWCRVPPRADDADLANSPVLVGDHTEPASVLAWLEGFTSDPWGESDADTVELTERLVSMLRR